ncbi:MAG: uroporphyrinogen decarboxylase [Gemmatimonadota bacterium]
MPNGTTLFERACRGERGDRTPVWVMRQAGRYLPEYRALRKEIDFLTATKTPEIAAKITLQPIARFPVDAAILFADIMTPLEGMGVPLHFAPGPVIESPIRTAEAVDGLRALDAERDVPFVTEALRIVRSELPDDRALIAFSGAPFTLFCYLVQGGGSKDFMEARAFLRGDSDASGRLLRLLGTSMKTYLLAQARAGADALMVFDSWVGLLDDTTYRARVLPILQDIIAGVKAEVDRPIIYFANGGSALLEAASETGADVIGLDWTRPLSAAVDRLGPDAVLQGNLDPSALFASRDELGREIDRIVSEGLGAAGHVFNLGHGIHRTTDPDQLGFLVDRVHETSGRLIADRGLGGGS